MPKASTKPLQRPSSNWLALQKKLVRKSDSNGTEASSSRPAKRRKTESSHTSLPSPEPEAGPKHSQAAATLTPTLATASDDPEPSSSKPGAESVSHLRKMVLGELEYTENHKMPGRYVAMDCEMVGVGIDGSESSLARVSLVNFYGAVQLDEFVRQRERVVDYRTQYSGIREKDMFKAKPFDEVQRRVAELLEDRILVGHAVFNDLKALLLSHPRPQTRDTQYYAGKHKVVKTKYVALRNLVKQELDLAIQAGEHSSVTDARAAMAVYRLHRHEWEKNGPFALPHGSHQKRKRKRSTSEAGDAGQSEAEAEFGGSGKLGHPGGGRKGVSSGLSTVVRRGSAAGAAGDRGAANVNVHADAGKKSKGAWWKELGGSSKGSVRRT